MTNNTALSQAIHHFENVVAAWNSQQEARQVPTKGTHAGTKKASKGKQAAQ